MSRRFLLKYLILVSLILSVAASAQIKPRARDLGVPFDGTPGPNNAITDVKGVEVGHTTLISGSGKLVVGTVPVRTGVTAPDQMPYDVAERKGIGHPDSLADLVADRFSKAYSTACLDAHGVILNHWVDKVTLVGAAARVSYGGFTIDRP